MDIVENIYLENLTQILGQQQKSQKMEDNFKGKKDVMAVIILRSLQR